MLNGRWTVSRASARWALAVILAGAAVTSGGAAHAQRDKPVHTTTLLCAMRLDIRPSNMSPQTRSLGEWTLTLMPSQKTLFIKPATAPRNGLHVFAPVVEGIDFSGDVLRFCPIEERCGRLIEQDGRAAEVGMATLDRRTGAFTIRTQRQTGSASALEVYEARCTLAPARMF